MALLSKIGVGVPITTYSADAAGSVNLAGAKEEEPAVTPALLLFALPLEDLENTTLGKAGAQAPILDDKLDSKLADQLAGRAVVVFPCQNGDLDSSTMGKGEPADGGCCGGKKKGKAALRGQPAPDPLKGVKEFGKNLGTSAFAACVSESLAVPFDTAKVKMQLNPGTGMLECMGKVASEEGTGALWRGIIPGLHRQILFGGLRIGLYDPVKGAIQKLMYGDNLEGPAPLPLKIAAGMATGSIAMCVASPTELVKVRIQSGAVTYPSAMKAYSTIAKEEGIGALWNGLAPNVIANSVINAAELAGYDQTKETLLSMGWKDGLPTHLMGGIGAGVSAVVFGSPFDVVKSKVLDDSKGLYKNFFDCMGKTVSKDGLGALYAGFAPNLVYRAGWNMCCFTTLEAVKSLLTAKPEPAKKA